MKKLNIFLAFAILVIGACEINVDVTPPTMEILTLTPSPEERIVCGSTQDSVFYVEGGDQLVFEAILRDDDKLSQYKIDIHSNFDCHGHGGASAPGGADVSTDGQTEDLVDLMTVDISGNEHTMNYTLNIPNNVTAGNYHFQVQVIDESGNDIPNSNIYSIVAKNTTNTIPPQISTTMPTGNFTIKKGESANFVGTVTDETSLSEGGNGLLFLSYTDRNSGNTFTTNKVFAFDSSVDKSFDFDFNYTIPQTLVAGSYYLTLHATDGVRNVAAPIQYEVEITN